MQKFIIKQAPLNRALKQISAIKTNIPSIQAFTFAYLKADANQASISIYTSDQFLTIPITQYTGDIDIALPAKLFLSAVSKFTPTDDITITKQTVNAKTTVCIQSGNKYFTLDNQDIAKHQPKLKFDTTIKRSFNVTSAELLTAINATRHCISTEKSRFYLNGINVNIFKGKLAFTTTDGHRLAIYQFAEPKVTTHKLSAIIPREVINQLLAIIKPTNPPVQMQITPNHITFDGEIFKLHSKLIDGNYPDIAKVIPKKSPVMIDAPCQQLLEISKEFGACAFDGHATITIDKKRLSHANFYNSNPTLKLNMSIKCNGNQCDATTTIATKYFNQCMATFSNLNNANKNPDIRIHTPLDTIGECAISPILIKAKGVNNFQMVLMPRRI